MKTHKSLQWNYILALLATLAMGSYAYAGPNAATQDAATKLGAGAVEEVGFSSGSAALTETARQDLETFIADAKQKGEIAEVRVAAWADQEYPMKGVTVAKGERELAEKRADTIEDYISKNLNVGHVNTMNMAERPNIVQKTFKTKEYKSKKAMEEKGAAPTDDKGTGLFALKGKASRAVVMVFYK